jgi:hypothetical protein
VSESEFEPRSVEFEGLCVLDIAFSYHLGASEVVRKGWGSADGGKGEGRV